MRFRILRALFMKEVRRHVANRGGIALAALLVVAALLLSVFNPTTPAGGENATGGGELVDGVHTCYIEYQSNTQFVQALQKRVPPGLKVGFRKHTPDSVTAVTSDSPGTGIINIVEKHSPTEWSISFDVWPPRKSPGALAIYELWLWRTARDYFQERAAESLGQLGGPGLRAKLTSPPAATDDLWSVRDSFRTLGTEVTRLQAEVKTKDASKPLIPSIEITRSNIGANTLEFRTAIATGMVVFAIYFACCYLLPTLNCEEREKGVLLAQALSPASPAELVVAKFLFYPVMGIGLAAILAGIYSPSVLNSLFFWLALLALSSGFLGIGMTVSTLAKTQRGAFMGSMCYLLSVSLILFICSANRIPYVSYLAIEFHGPRCIHAAMTQNVKPEDWQHLIAAIFLGAAWMTAAGWLFRRRGWQ